MANINEILSPRNIIHRDNAKLNVQVTKLNMESMCNRTYMDKDVRNVKGFRDNFNLSDVIESSPDAKVSSMLHNNSYSFDDLCPLSSTLRCDDDECKTIDGTNCTMNSSDEPPTSTPQRKIQSTLQKYKINRPPNLIIHNASVENNCDNSNMNILQCSPVHSPFPGLDDTLDLDNSSFVDLDDTLEPPHYVIPPKGIELDKRAKKMVHLLQRYGLTHFAFFFVEQEVDIDLFLTLTDFDLQEIGIQRKRDRNLLLTMIKEYNERNCLMKS